MRRPHACRGAFVALAAGTMLTWGWSTPATAQVTAAPKATAQTPLEPIEPVEPTDPGPGDPGPTDPGPTNPDPAPDTGQYMCAADLNKNGDAADAGETAYCAATTGGGHVCPLQKVSCVADAAGQYSCPVGNQFACQTEVGGGPPSCSPNRCANLATTPIITEPPIEDPGTAPDGAVDADGNCMGTIEIFSGRGMRCRPAGLSTTLADCCKDKGKILRDGMGSSLGSLSTKIAVVKGVFQGMSAAFTALRAGATAGQAANAGANALIVGLDPTSIAISLAINFMIEFLFSGCDQEDMETAMLNGSGMCHFIDSYCTTSFLGLCLQKAHGHCCFNTKLGRIIQEQGRPQLKSFNGNLWGTARKPMCRGFTPEEFQALDFSKIDLSEYYADIEARAQADIQIDMKDRVDAYLNAVKN